MEGTSVRRILICFCSSFLGGRIQILGISRVIGVSLWFMVEPLFILMRQLRMGAGHARNTNRMNKVSGLWAMWYQSNLHGGKERWRLNNMANGAIYHVNTWNPSQNYGPQQLGEHPCLAVLSGMSLIVQPGPFQILSNGSLPLAGSNLYILWQK